MMTRKVWCGAVIALCAALAIGIANNTRDPEERQQTQAPEAKPQSAAPREVRLQELLAQTEAMPPSLSPEAEVAANKRSRQLYEIWLERDNRDVATDILPYLQDEYVVIRDSAARMLGRLESPVAEAPLSHREQEMERLQKGKAEEAHKIFVGKQTLQLALGRIGARGLKGKAKLSALVRGFGLSFDDLAWLSQKVQSAGGGGGPPESPAAIILEEAIDLLYTMAKQGEDVDTLVKRLTLKTTQRVKIQAGALSPNREAELLIDYFSSNVSNIGDYMLAHHLAGLGPQVYPAILQRLQKLRPQNYAVRRGKIELLVIAARMRGDDALPIIESFEDDPDPRVRHEVKQLQNLIKWKALAPPLP